MPGSTRLLPAEPDAVSPGGGAEIRHILTSPQGDLTHAVCRAGAVAPTHHLPELDEIYYVLAGEGEIWRATDEHEAVTALRPGRWVLLSAGTRFQYRADRGTSLVFLVVVLPSWAPELFHTVDDGPWRPGTDDRTPPTEQARLVDGWMSGDLPQQPDERAADGAELRRLGWFEKGSLAHWTVPAGASSRSAGQQGVHEIWFVTDGHGELWRASGDEETVELLWPGVGVDVPAGTSVQVRGTGVGALSLVRLSMPGRPGRS